MARSSSIISVKHFFKTFDDKTVISNVSFEVKKGESLVLIGGSGSGKSVLLKSIAGLIFPDKGSRVMFNNKDVSNIHLIDRKWLQRKFAMVFQNNALFDSLQIWENVCFALINTTGISKKDAVEHSIEKLHLVGLKGEEVVYKYPFELSGGMQKRVAIARAIAIEPEIVFFDEPTSGLDPVMTDVVAKLMKKLVKDDKLTTITITHSPKVMKEIADKVVLLEKGNIAWCGDLKSTLESDHAFLKMFINENS